MVPGPQEGPVQVLTELTLIFIDFELIQVNLRCGKGGTLLAGPGRHLASLRHCVGLSWLTEWLTGTFWLTGRDKTLKTGTVPAKTGRMVCLVIHCTTTSKVSSCRILCMLCQQTSPKRWFANGNMMSYCDVTNSVYPVTMATIRQCSKPALVRGA